MLKVLSIGAHPDDVELGMGGTLVRHKKKGDEVQILLCTLGGVSGDPKIREEEAYAAGHLMNVDTLHVLDHPVSKLNRINAEFVRLLKTVIDGADLDRIYVHSPFDMHQVHTTVSECAVRAAKDVKQILFFETVSSTTGDFRPNAFVDITPFIDSKITCVQAHKTQSHRIYLHPTVLRSVANYRYIQGRVGSKPGGFAEAFRIHKMIM